MIKMKSRRVALTLVIQKAEHRSKNTTSSLGCCSTISTHLCVAAELTELHKKTNKTQKYVRDKHMAHSPNVVENKLIKLNEITENMRSSLGGGQI